MYELAWRSAFSGSWPFLISSVLSAQASAREEIISESVRITGAPHLPKDVRARLASQMRGREFEGNPNKWVGNLESAVLEAATVRIDKPRPLTKVIQSTLRARITTLGTL